MQTLPEQVHWYSTDIEFAIKRGYETVNLQIPVECYALWNTSEEFLENMFEASLDRRVEVKKSMLGQIQVLSVRW